jgi:hypothetical protein
MLIYTSTFKYYDNLQGNIAVAVRASCTFPGMFQPVMIDGIGPCIDGGVWDHAGLMAMPYAIQGSMISSASTLAATRDDHDSSSGSSSGSSGGGEDGEGTITLIDDHHQVIIGNNPENTIDDSDVDQADINHGNSSSTVTSLIEVSKTAEIPFTHHHLHHLHHHPLKKLVVNIIFGRSYISTSKLPDELSSHKVDKNVTTR